MMLNTPVFLYVVSLPVIILALYGIYFFVMTALFRHGVKDEVRAEQELLKEFYQKHDIQQLPVVTTQIPLFNEYNVAERVIDAVVAFEYPSGKHQIQVLDDSTDETTTLIAHKVRTLQAAGVWIEHVTRRHRTGFKAGALANGLASAKGDFIAIFDADFVPASDFLLKTIPFFLMDFTVGLVQCRWHDLNREKNVLTRLQSIGLNGLFVVEQAVSSWNHLFMNFNGSAGILRKQAILDAGNWDGTILTEDLDISYRLQLAGWTCRYLLTVTVSSELPDTIHALRIQQFRWAKGTIQTARKLLPAIWRSAHPLRRKLSATIQLTQHTIYPLVMLLTCILPLGLMGDSFQPQLSLFAGGLGMLAMALMGPFWLYWTSETYLARGNIPGRAVHVLLLLCLGCGLSVNNAQAVFEGGVGKHSDFLRTPKKGSRTLPKKIYHLPINWLFLLELILGIWCVIGLRFFCPPYSYVIHGFLILWMIGFGFVGGRSFLEVVTNKP